MPVYDYDCVRCGPFTELRPMAECEAPLACPECGAAAPRAFLTAPRLATMDGARRTASATNERSAHQPRLSSSSHGPGCSCCSGGARRARTAKAPDGKKSFPSARPWMISH
jgi:putative FmdB family regulatory protein